MKSTYRALGLVAALTLVSFASANVAAAAGSCAYRCKNTATGAFTIVTAGYSEADCCSGNVTCPTGSTYQGTLYYNNGRGPVRCI